MARRICLLLAALLSASVAAARYDAVRTRMTESQTDTLHSVLAGIPTRIAGRGLAAGRKPLIVLRSGGREYAAESLGGIDHSDIKSVTVLKSDSGRLFEKYGDTSEGVIIVDLRETARIPDGARIVRKPAQQDGTGGKGADKPLILATDGRGEPKALKMPAHKIKPEDVESIDIIKNDEARKYDSYGDTSKGVAIIRFKEGRLPKQVEQTPADRRGGMEIPDRRRR